MFSSAPLFNVVFIALALDTVLRNKNTSEVKTDKSFACVGLSQEGVRDYQCQADN